jgi:RimK family alpha-L-glutamate ligase
MSPTPNAKSFHFLILGTLSSFAIQQCIKTIKKRGHSFDLIGVKDVCFTTKNSSIQIEISKKNGMKNILDYDAVFIHGFHNPLGEMYYLGHYLKKNKIPFLDTAILTNPKIKDKWYQSFIFSQNNIPHPKTIKTRSLSSWKCIRKDISLPVIAKSLNPHMSDQGRGIYKLSSQKEYLEFFSNKNSCDDYLIQEYVPITYDYRILVLDNTVLGCIKRTMKKSDFRTNVSQGGNASLYIPSQDMCNLALKTAKVFQSTFCGIDIIEHKNRFFVLEINFGPQWHGFQKATNIDVSKKIISFLEEKLVS